MTEPIRVGTRRSLLALTQTESVLVALRRRHPRRRFEAVPIVTSGDRDRNPGSLPDFTDAIDRALRAGTIDLAVHSAKDLPARLPPEFCMVACPPRADPRDGLVVAPGVDGRRLPQGARIGSSSVRRRAQLLRWRPDLRIVEIRGNVDTRIARVRRGEFDAAILAVAGIARLGRHAEIARVLPRIAFLPAPAQGALAVVARADDPARSAILASADHRPTHLAVVAEQAFAAALGGDCRIPLGALATLSGARLSLTGEIVSPDGRRTLRARLGGSAVSAQRIGTELGERLLARGARELGAPGPA